MHHSGQESRCGREQILAAKAEDAAADVSTLERAINELVADLYGLDAEEKQLIGLTPHSGATPPPAAPPNPPSPPSFNASSSARAAEEGAVSRAPLPHSPRPPAHKSERQLPAAKAEKPGQTAKADAEYGRKQPEPASKPAASAAAAPALEDFDESRLLCAVRSTLAARGELAREDALREIATSLGFGRLGPRLRERLESALRVAVRRGIAQSTPENHLQLATRSIDEYSRDDLIAALRAVATAWTERDAAIKSAARRLGFARTGNTIRDHFKSAINGAIRRGLLEYDGTLVRKR